MTGGGKWPLKNGHMTAKKRKHLRTTNVTKNFSRRIVVICLVVERSLEIACMAFCTWNKTLKGNTPVYYSCAYLYWFKVRFVCFFHCCFFSFFCAGKTRLRPNNPKSYTNASPPSKTTPPARSQAGIYCSPASQRRADCALTSVYWQMCPAVIITISCTSLESSTEAQPKAIPL